MLLTWAPKGQRHSRPILKVCNATGMPMMVMAIAKLPVKYPMAASRPPKSHHNRLPINLILVHYFKRCGTLMRAGVELFILLNKCRGLLIAQVTGLGEGFQTCLLVAKLDLGETLDKVGVTVFWLKGDALFC